MTDHDTNGANRKESLEARIASTLEANCAELDSQVRRRLDRIRAAAVARAPAEPPVRRFWGPRWQPMATGAVAAAIALALAVLIDPSPEIDPLPITADLDVLTDPQFELFVEDPEFVAWVAEAESESPPAETSG